MLKNYCLSLILSCTFMCSTGSNSVSADDSAHWINTGNSRLSKVVSVNGNRDRIYQYDSLGRLQESKAFRRGNLWLSLIYSYDASGKLHSRLRDVVSKGGKDVLRQYVYEGDRFLGYFSSVVGEAPNLVVKYQYAGGRIIGYEERVLDSQNDNQGLTDGTLNRTGTYSYNEKGHLSSWKYRNADGTGGWDYFYETNMAGQRIGSEIGRPGLDPYIISTYVYEAEPCTELPQGQISQWICVQMML